MKKVLAKIGQVTTTLMMRGKSITNIHKDESSDQEMKIKKEKTTPQAHKDLYEDRGDLGAC